jgi:hypothetical protein
VAIFVEIGGPNERPVREPSLPVVPVLDAREISVGSDDPRDAERPGHGPLHESDVQELSGSEGASEGTVPQGARDSEPAPCVSDLLDAVSLAYDASAKLEAAIRENRATGPALEVFRECHKRVVELAYEIERRAA